MTVRDGFTERLGQAWGLFVGARARQGRATYPDFAEIVGRVRVPPRTYDQSMVAKWLEGSVPGLDTIAALAVALNVDPGWLAFGDRSLAPAPSLTAQRAEQDGGSPPRGEQQDGPPPEQRHA